MNKQLKIKKIYKIKKSLMIINWSLKNIMFQ